MFSVGSGEYEIKIRGIPQTMYCKMDISPAKTYLSMTAIAKWGGAYTVEPKSEQTMQWTKAEVTYDQCMSFIRSWGNNEFMTGSGPSSGHDDYIFSRGEFPVFELCY